MRPTERDEEPSLLTLTELARPERLDELRGWLEGHSTVEVCAELPRLDPPARAFIFRLLPKDRALAVFEALDSVHQQELVDGLRREEVHELIEGLEPDDRARLFDEMPAKVVKRLMAHLPQAERDATAMLLGYPSESAGHIMTTAFVGVRATMTAAEGLDRVRRVGGDAGNLRVLMVTDDELRLQGMVDLAAVVMADPGARVADLMDAHTYFVRVDEDQEVAARLMQEADLVSLPVVDHEDRLVGVITVDDAMAVLEAEDTEDISRIGGAEPLQRAYMSASVWYLARRRATWLLVLLFAAALTVNVLQYFADTLETIVTLALFIPLLIDAGGNSGSQASTTVIRAMAVGEVRFGDLAPVMFRETRVGLLLGAMLSVVAFPVASLFFGWQLAAVVALSLVTICTWASFIGGLLPILAERVGVDPAVVSAPIITTLVDATGLVIYFLIARAILLG
jgi:magnesium transporter